MATRRQVANLQLETDQLRELFTLLRTLPSADAHAALDRIRSIKDPLAALRFVKEAASLLIDSDLEANQQVGERS